MTHFDQNLRPEQLANPFRPGNGVAPPYLAGRDRVLAGFEAFVAERPLHQSQRGAPDDLSATSANVDLQAQGWPAQGRDST